MDIKCVVCGEPWDAYCVRHGDMLHWEAKLFRQGAGCPSCKGEAPIEAWHPTRISDVENGDGDEHERIAAYERYQSGLAPAWKRPDDVVLWTCDGCGVQSIVNADNGELGYYVPFKSKADDWYVSHNFRDVEPSQEPAHKFTDGRCVCSCCLVYCDICGKHLCDKMSHDDAYDEGVAFRKPGSDYYEPDHVCVDCLLQAEYDYARECWRSMRVEERRDVCSQCGVPRSKGRNVQIPQGVHWEVSGEDVHWLKDY